MLRTRCARPVPFTLRLLPAAAWLGCWICAPQQARAQELSDDAARVQILWQNGSSRVTRLAPRFLNPGQALALRLPLTAVVREPQGCTSLAILGTRNTGFTVSVRADGPSPKPIKPEVAAHRSAAGVMFIVRCGEQRRELAEMTVRLSSGRAALEFVVAEGPSPAPPLDALLPERQAGPTGQLIDVGVTPDVEPLAVRIAEAERRALAAGARLLPRRILVTQPHGGDALGLQLAEGCHRLMLLPETRRSRPADVDAELHDRADRTLVRDRSNAPDAQLDVCVGESTSTELVWIASSRAAKVTLLQASWAIPPGIPLEWGPRARASTAAAHRKRASPAMAAPPIWQGNGLPGRTSIPIEVAPDGCYLISVAPARGDVRSLTLSVQTGISSHNDTGGGGYDSAMVGFCAAGSRWARVEVEANGQGLHWIAGMWKMGRTPLGAGDAW